MEAQGLSFLNVFLEDWKHKHISPPTPQICITFQMNYSLTKFYVKESKTSEPPSSLNHKAF